MNNLSLDKAVYLTKLFLPEFIEHDGGIFLANHFDLKNYSEWKTHLNGDIQAIEKVINHIHIEDVISYQENPDFTQLNYLGRSLGYVWEYHLGVKYPDRIFEVCCDCALNSVVVTFYQIKDKPDEKT